jgi:YidC/Oxa1 family membrane protein insertase
MSFLFFKVAAGLCLYFIASSLWGIAERKLIPRPDGTGGTSTAVAPSPAPKDSPSQKKKRTTHKHTKSGGKRKR